MELFLPNSRDNPPTGILRALRSFARAVEQERWHVLPPVRMDFDGQIDPCSVQHILERALKCAELTDPPSLPCRHRFYPRTISFHDAEYQIEAEVEIEMPLQEGDLFVMHLSATVTIVMTEPRWKVTDVIYHLASGVVERYAAWDSLVTQATDDLSAHIRSGRLIPPLKSWRSVAQFVLPPIITIAVDTTASEEWERPILDWAIGQAIDRWNSVLQGTHRLLRVEGVDHANIRIEATKTPIAGGFLAECDSHPRKAKRADSFIRILTAASSGRVSLPFAPEMVGQSVEHELGHALGLKDTNIPNAPMGVQQWNAELSGPSAAEAASVRRIGRQCALCLKHARACWGAPDGAPALWDDRTIVSRKDIGVIFRGTRCAESLLPKDQWVTHLWAGERLIRQHGWTQARREFVQAAALAPDPSEAALRMHVVDAIYAPEAGAALAALETAVRLRRQGQHVTNRHHIHLVLAARYRRMGQRAAAALHTAHADWLSSISKLSANQSGMIHLSEFDYLCLVRDLVQVVRCGIRNVICKARWHLR